MSTAPAHNTPTESSRTEGDVFMSDVATAALPSTPVRPTRPTSPLSSGKKRTRAEFNEEHSPSPSPIPPPVFSKAAPSSPRPPSPRPSPIDTTSSPTAHNSAEPASPTGTEIVEEYEETVEIAAKLQEAGIKVRDFAFESFPHEWKAPEHFDPMPPLIYNDWRVRNKVRTGHGTTPKELWRLIKMGWLKLSEMKAFWTSAELDEIEKYGSRTNPPPSAWVVVPKENTEMPTPLERVMMRKAAGYPSEETDLPDSHFFGSDALDGAEPQTKRQKTSPARKARPLQRSNSRSHRSAVMI